MSNLAVRELEPAPTRIETMNDHQPTYPDQDKLEEALLELREIPPITTPQNIYSLRGRLEATKFSGTKVYLVGRCTNDINHDTSAEQSAADSLALVRLVREEAPQSEVVLRDARGQSSKPRSQDTETLQDGTVVDTHKGDLINGLDPEDRMPDPSRMVAGAMQGREVEEILTKETGDHIYAAHEALLLPYEESFLEEKGGRRYLLSADLPWIGERTRSPGSAQVELLAGVENPVGIKIGAEATASDIESLANVLNPNQESSKLVFMLRVGVKNLRKLPEIIGAIKEHAPDSIVMCDPMHGNTRKLPGNIKTRFLEDIISEIKTAAKACKDQDMVLSGVHLEAMGTDERKECVDSASEVPSHISTVDPNLNLSQLRRVIKETAAHL